MTFDPKRVKLLASHVVPGALFAVALDAPRQVLYAAGTDGHLWTLDLKVARPVPVRGAELHTNYVSGLALCDGAILSVGFDQQLVWTEATSGRRIRAVRAHDGWVRKLALTPDARHVVSVGDDMLVKVWDARSGAAVAMFSGHPRRTPEGYLSALYTVAVSPDGSYAASGDRAGHVRIWELASRNQVGQFRATELYTFDAEKRARAIGGVRGLAFSPDGARLAVSGIGPVTNVDGFVGPCRVELWDWRAGRRMAAGQDRHQAILNHVAFGPEPGWLLAAGGGDSGGALVLWAGGAAAPVVLKPKGHLHAFVCNAAGTRLYAVGHSGIQVWEVRPG